MNHRTQQLINRQIRYCSTSVLSSSAKEETARFQGYLLALWHMHRINRDEYIRYTQNFAQLASQIGSTHK